MAQINLPPRLMETARRVALVGIYVDLKDWRGLLFEPREVWVSLEAKLLAGDTDVTAAERHAWSAVFDVVGQDDDECPEEEYDPIATALA
jgi:hypothetical protein